MQNNILTHDFFKVFVDQLKEGIASHIKESVGPEFLATDEKELAFESPVTIDAEIYIAHDELILRMNVETTSIQPCSICNEKISVPLVLHDVYQAVPLSEIKGGIYDFSSLVREELLLAVPHFVECQKGRCPKRKEFSKYLKDPDIEGPSDEGFRPFKDL